jgi:hypothetical protein
MKKIMMIICVLVAAYGASQAQTPKVVTSDKKGWHKIGETSVDFKRDRDAVDILGANRFAAIRFRVDDAPIDLIGAEVYYESGDKQDLKMSASIKPPGETDVINLNGGERSVKKIVFIYKTIPNYHDKMAHVEIWGLKTNTPR